LRSRLILIGTAGLAAGLALGGILLVLVVRVVLVRAVDNSARQSANDVADVLHAGTLADPIPTAGTQFIQVLDASGRVRAASVGSDRLVPLLHTPDEMARARRGEVVTVDADRLGLAGELRVVATTEGNDTILVGVPDSAVAESVATVRNALFVAYPLLVGGLALIAFRVVGATLRPVEALRRGAEEISAAQVGRLPVPPGDDEIRRLAVTLNHMLERLEAARVRQRAFVADAAHELRSPIASLRTQLDVAAHVGEAAPVIDLQTDVERLARLADDLLLLARADEADSGLVRLESVDLGDLLAQVAAGAGGRVPVKVGDAIPTWVRGDPLALRRIVDNLAANAVRHATSQVQLVTWRRAGRVGFTVSDDGPGIPAADRERVFDRFTRLDDARNRDDGGAGLGLSIVRELVRLHDGTVRLEDAQPGLRVVVSLPALPEETG
jgi:signal transduction histidine kinase